MRLINDGTGETLLLKKVKAAVMCHEEMLGQFTVGSLFKMKEGGLCGWITGLNVNPVGEVVFSVRWAVHPSDEALCHPALIEPLGA